MRPTLASLDHGQQGGAVRPACAAILRRLGRTADQYAVELGARHQRAAVRLALHDQAEPGQEAPLGRQIAAPLMALPDVQVTLGHSEGAALALLFAAELCLAGRPPRAVYAFEPPLVSADGTLAALFAARGVTRYLTQNGNDVVPDVPRLCEPWQHPAPLQRIGRAALPFPNVDDHLIAHVVVALATAPA